ncbi:component of SufBCD complex [Pseudooceanicola sp. HF7]|uniref:component of SufBCD complex n=1 Tax=Pseudooceanicola sp. HF7 TaxID=2721560 RepID=UPI00142F8BA1|nr:component of SufBCD complex [Pseudooceanicola sp. HF7]NIZ11640.1 component of SufBCD complex [Pseudooceanicola sp. HF7]
MTPWDSITELLDLRSFSNLWFWIFLAVLWVGVSHWVMGVSYSLVLRARSDGGRAEEDLFTLLRLRVEGLTRMAERTGVFSVATISFLLTALAMLGFLYKLEFAQALFLILLPLLLVLVLTVRTARRIAADESRETIYLRLRRLKAAVQSIGMLAVLLTTTWGMYVNASLGVLGR